MPVSCLLSSETDRAAMGAPPVTEPVSVLWQQVRRVWTARAWCNLAPGGVQGEEDFSHF